MGTNRRLQLTQMVGAFVLATGLHVIPSVGHAQSNSVPISATKLEDFTLDNEHICAVTFSPDGKYIAAGDTSGEVYLYDIVKNSVAWHRDSQPTEAIGRVALCFTDDSEKLFVASSTEGTAIWNVVDGSRWRRLCGTTRQLEVFLASKYNKNHSEQLVFGAKNRDLVSWTAAGGEVDARIADAGIHVTSLAVAADRNLIATGMGDGGIVVSKWPSGSRVFEKRVSRFCIYSLAISPNGTRLLVGSDSEITCLDFSENRKLWNRVGRCVYSDGLAMTSDGRFVVFADSDGGFLMCDASDGTVACRGRLGEREELCTAFCFDEVGRRMSAGTDHSRIVVWDLKPDHLDLKTLPSENSDDGTGAAKGD